MIIRRGLEAWVLAGLLGSSLGGGALAEEKAKGQGGGAGKASGEEPVVDEPSSPALRGRWKEPYALLFNLNNLMTSGGVLTAYQNMGLGFRYHPKAWSAVRVGLTASRSSTGAYETTQTITSEEGTVTTEGYLPPGPSSLALGASVDYLRRLRPDRLSPYVGVGGELGYWQSTLRYTDAVSIPDTTVLVDNRQTSLSLWVTGSAGVDWRIHPSFSLSAEYGLAVEALSRSAYENMTRIDVSSEGYEGWQEEVESGETVRFLNTSLGLRQGFSLGLACYF